MRKVNEKRKYDFVREKRERPPIVISRARMTLDGSFTFASSSIPMSSIIQKTKMQNEIISQKTYQKKRTEIERKRRRNQNERKKGRKKGKKEERKKERGGLSFGLSKSTGPPPSKRSPYFSIIRILSFSG